MILKTGNNKQVLGIEYWVSAKTENRKSRTKLRTPNSKLAFTLVELMISVVILGFGLCVVIQSYMSALSGFNTSQNYIEAMRFAKEKESELEIAAYENKGLLPEAKSGETILGSREFHWKTEVSEIPNSGNFSNDFVMAAVSMDWRERNIQKNNAIVTYLPKRKELEEESGQK